jgi:hypothetical protein
MRSIFELAPKPSDAVRAMIDGLREHSKREDFKINMAYFGLKPTLSLLGDSNICYGCAATCALQKITGVTLVWETIEEVGRVKAYDLQYGDMKTFEIAIDGLRCGELNSLFSYYGVPQIRWFDFNLPHLKTDSWEAGLPRYEKLYKKLIEKGL